MGLLLLLLVGSVTALIGMLSLCRDCLLQQFKGYQQLPYQHAKSCEQYENLSIVMRSSQIICQHTMNVANCSQWSLTHHSQALSMNVMTNSAD